MPQLFLSLKVPTQSSGWGMSNFYSRKTCISYIPYYLENKIYLDFSQKV